jgi:putative endonuclease
VNVHERMILGNAAEDLVAADLRRRGYDVVARNVRAPWGEIDVIARNATQLVIVEVRSRRGGDPDDPADSISAAKRRKVRLTAERWLAWRPIDYREVRFFAALVTWQDGKAAISMVEDAF